MDLRCRICGCDARPHLTGQFCNGYTIARCDGCETVAAAEKPEPSELKRLYDDFFTGDEYAAHRREFDQIQAGRIPRSYRREGLLGRLEKMSKGRHLIEIGGGTGGFGVVAKAKGWNYVDYDISDIAVGFTRELALDARTFPAGEVPPLPPQSADVIVMWEVLEHVWNVREYLDVVRDALRPHGILLFSTPNWHQARHRSSFTNDRERSAAAPMDTMGPPVHVNFFTKRSLHKMLSACGFRLVHISTTRLYRPASTLSSILTCARIVAGIEAPHTLYGIAVKS